MQPRPARGDQDPDRGADERQPPEQACARKQRNRAQHDADFNGVSKTNVFRISGVSTSARTSSAIHLHSVSCAPRALAARSAGLCTLKLDNVNESDLAEVQLSSSSESVKLPATVTTMPGQSSLEFQIDALDPAADQDEVAVTAHFNGDAVRDTVEFRSAHRRLMKVPGHQMVKFGDDLHFTVSAEYPAVSVSAGFLPAGATFDGTSGAFHWTPYTAQQGTHEIAFLAVDAAGHSDRAVVKVDVDAGEAVVTRIVNAASRMVDTACGPGTIASIEGRWLAQDAAMSDRSGNSVKLGGTSVLVNGTAVPVLYSSSRRLDFLCPSAPAGTALNVVVQTASQVTSPVEITERELALGIFSMDGSGTGQGMVLHDDESSVAMIRNYRYAAQPAHAGDRLVVYATGITETSKTQARVGDVTAVIESVTPVIQSPGLYGIVTRIPTGAVAGNTVAIDITGRVSNGSMVSSNKVNIAIEPMASYDSVQR